MRFYLPKVAMIAVAAGTLASASAGHAQGWGFWGGDSPLRGVCSGERARGLEARLRHEQRDGDIDPDTADRIHDAIDRLEDRSRGECDEGDRRAIWNIAQRFDRIQGWIENSAHGGWRRGW